MSNNTQTQENYPGPGMGNDTDPIGPVDDIRKINVNLSGGQTVVNSVETVTLAQGDKTVEFKDGKKIHVTKGATVYATIIWDNNLITINTQRAVVVNDNQCIEVLDKFIILKWSDGCYTHLFTSHSNGRVRKGFMNGRFKFTHHLKKRSSNTRTPSRPGPRTGPRVVPPRVDTETKHVVIQKKIKIPTTNGVGKNINCAVSEYRSKTLAWGEEQSGKTLLTITQAHNVMQTHSCCGIYITRNFDSELKEQAISIEDEFIAMPVPIRIRVKPVSSRHDNFKLLEQIMRKGSNNAETYLFVFQANSANIRNLFDILIGGQTYMYALAIDESDIYIPKKDNKVVEQMSILMEGAVNTQLISATALDNNVFLKDTDKVQTVCTNYAFDESCVVDGQRYRSMGRAIFKELPVTSRGDVVNVSIEQGVSIVGEMISNGLVQEYNDKQIPAIVGHFASERNATNCRIAKKMSEQIIGGKSIVGITADQTGVHAFVGGVDDGKTYDSISEVLAAYRDWFDDGESRPVLYLMGGKMFSRSFRITDRRGDGMYISALVYSMSEQSDASLMKQRFGRLCGKSNEDMLCQQYIYATRQNYERVMDCRDATKNFVQAFSENPIMDKKEVLTKIEIAPRKSKKSLSVNEVEKKFKVNPTKVRGGGNTSTPHPKSILPRFAGVVILQSRCQMIHQHLKKRHRMMTNK
jgi:hypothetical protein